MAQWIEHQPANQRVAGLIPSQDTCLGCRPGPQVGARERQPHIDVSLRLFLLPFLSLKLNELKKIDKLDFVKNFKSLCIKRYYQQSKKAIHRLGKILANHILHVPL